MNRRFAIAVLLVALVCVIQSCSHKDLCYDHNHVVDFEIKFDWSKAPDAAPRTMVVRIFHMDGSFYRRYEFITREGGKVRLDAGQYKMLFHNGDMESVREVDNDYDNYSLTTIQQELLAPIGRVDNETPRPDDSEAQPVHNAPETVWGGREEYVEVGPGAESGQVTLMPEEVTSVYNIEIRNVVNMSEDIGVSAALTGMAECWQLAAAGASAGPVTIPIALERRDEHTFTARVVSFGHCPVEKLSHWLSVYTTNQYYYHFDVSSQFHEVEDDGNILIIIEGLKLPDPDATGMSPSVSGWSDDINNDINMN